MESNIYEMKALMKKIERRRKIMKKILPVICSAVTALATTLLLEHVI